MVIDQKERFSLGHFDPSAVACGNKHTFHSLPQQVKALHKQMVIWVTLLLSFPPLLHFFLYLLLFLAVNS